MLKKTIFEEKLGVKRSLLDKARKEQKRKEKLEEAYEEDKIISDRDADSDEKRSAEERVAMRENDLRQITAQLEENMSLQEKIKEIFKKYGVSVTAIFQAAGATIATVVGIITKALKATGKELENGLRKLGKKSRFCAARADRLDR